ncbi:MAG TPA: RICIN domain-containing protein, partial [Candidatus Collinsella stercoripullorum]|nr:RICIN domain-containing protein [Candidatus Collinsella stercoripullorum]
MPMRRFQYAVAVIMTAVMCLMPVLQPYAAYAEVLAAERQLYGTSDSSAVEDGAGTSAATEDGSADEGSAGEEASSSTGGSGDGSAAVEPTQPSDAGSEIAGSADSAADASTEDAQVTADEAADAAAGDGERDISADEFRGNSWRFENGQLIEGVDDESAPSGNFRARAMNALPEGATAQGIDVSEFQYRINWDAVKASGVDFAIIRIGWWNNGVDKYFERNVAECERLGIPWGAYLYSYSMDAEDAASEANHAIDLMNQMKAKGYTPDLPVYLDLEDKEVPLDAAKLATISSTFNGKIAAAGYEPGVYASASWWKNYLTSPVFDSWSKWSAQYYSVCEAPSDPDMWQYTSSGSVPGISGPVDVNYWLSDPSFTEEAQRAELDALAEENRGALPDGTYAVVAGVGSRKVLDVASGSKSDGANVQIYASNATSAQRWRVSHDGDGYVTLVNVGSGKALDVYGA